MGDSILASLSLPPSGRVASNHLTGAGKPSGERWNGSQPGDASPFITPVIGLIPTEKLPVVIAARERAQQAGETTNEQLDSSKNHAFTSVKQREKANEDGGKEVREQEEDEGSILNRSSAVKRKQEDRSDSETEGDGALVTTSKQNRVNGHRQSMNQSEEDEGDGARDLLREHGVGKLPEDPFLCSVFASCLSRQPRVVLEKLSSVSSGSSSSSGGGGGGGGSFYKKQVNHRIKLPEWKQTSHRQSSECPGLDNKENQPVFPSVSYPSSHQRSNAEATALRGDGDEYVADSEDEGMKNFKGRLFVKRYYKTKHGSYVPTLREFWKPSVTRRYALCAGSKRR